MAFDNCEEHSDGHVGAKLLVQSNAFLCSLDKGLFVLKYIKSSSNPREIDSGEGSDRDLSWKSGREVSRRIDDLAEETLIARLPGREVSFTPR